MVAMMPPMMGMICWSDGGVRPTVGLGRDRHQLHRPLVLFKMIPTAKHMPEAASEVHHPAIGDRRQSDLGGHLLHSGAIRRGGRAASGRPAPLAGRETACGRQLQTGHTALPRDQ